MARPGLRAGPGGSVTTFVRLLQDCYILDHSGTKIYVWKGRGATKAEKQMAMSKALVGATDAYGCQKNSVSNTSAVLREPEHSTPQLLKWTPKPGKLGFKSRFNAIPWGCCED